MNKHIALSLLPFMILTCTMNASDRGDRNRGENNKTVVSTSKKGATSNTDQITQYDNWMICSPNSSLVSTSNNMLYGSYDNLVKLGENAHQSWKEHSHLGNLIENLDETFKPVNHLFLIELIDQILKSEALLEEITKASYKNITGFLKIVLASGGKNSWKIRLHVWEQKEKEYPHNHKWDFFSKIITGYLKQSIYQETDDFTAIKYQTREPVSLMPLLSNGERACPCRDFYALEIKKSPDQAVFLNIQNQNIIGTGESYFMSHDLIHTIEPGKHAITFVFTSEHITENSEVFTPCDLADIDLQKYAPSITKEELIKELMFIKTVLSRLSLSSKYLPELIHPNHVYFNRNSSLLANKDWRQDILESSSSCYVAQLNEYEKDQFKIQVDQSGNILIGNNQILKNTDYLFVLLDNVMYASPKDFAHQACRLICHTSFTDYAPVDAAGLLKFNEEGLLVKIEAYSGHYEPSIHHMNIAYKYLQSIHANMNKVVIVNYQDRI